MLKPEGVQAVYTTHKGIDKSVTVMYYVYVIKRKDYMNKKLLLTGLVIIAVFNPLAVNLWSDALVTALDLLAREMISFSGYTMVIGATLVLVSGLLIYSDKQASEKKRLKSLKNKKTSKAGEYIAKKGK